MKGRGMHESRQQRDAIQAVANQTVLLEEFMRGEAAIEHALGHNIATADYGAGK